MKTLIEKWSPLLNYKLSDGKSVPIDEHQECAETLERLEKKYQEAGMMEQFRNGIVGFCIRSYAEGKEKEFGGGILEFTGELQNN